MSEETLPLENRGSRKVPRKLAELSASTNCEVHPAA